MALALVNGASQRKLFTHRNIPTRRAKTRSRGDAAEMRTRDYLSSWPSLINSTWKMSVAFGGMSGALPFSS